MIDWLIDCAIHFTDGYTIDATTLTDWRPDCTPGQQLNERAAHMWLTCLQAKDIYYTRLELDLSTKYVGYLCLSCHRSCWLIKKLASWLSCRSRWHESAKMARPLLCSKYILCLLGWHFEINIINVVQPEETGDAIFVESLEAKLIFDIWCGTCDAGSCHSCHTMGHTHTHTENILCTVLRVALWRVLIKTSLRAIFRALLMAWQLKFWLTHTRTGTRIHTYTLMPV